MKKKIMAVTLCLAMVSTFAVGCGQKNETDSGKSEEKSSGKVEIEFVQVKREAAESYTKVIEAFEKENPDIVIKQNVVPDAQEVLMTRASSDSLPDMMNHWPTDAQFVQFEDEGLLLDLSEKDYMKNIDSKYLDAVKAKDGKNYIAPYNVNFMGVYYNKDKFEEAGYTMPTKWDELIALAEEIMSYGSMGAGILSGKIRSVPSFEKNDLRLNFYDVYKEPKFSKIMELLKVMDSIADGHNVPVGQVALNWSTQKEYVGTALVGVRSIEHADENCKTFDWKLTEEEMKILDSKIEECAL